MACLCFCCYYTCPVLCTQEYVPFQPYIEGPFLVVLHIAKTLPRYIAAAAAAAGSTAAGPSPLAAVFGGLSAADAQSATYAIADPASLGKLKRDLFFRWAQQPEKQLLICRHCFGHHSQTAACTTCLAAAAWYSLAFWCYQSFETFRCCCIIPMPLIPQSVVLVVPARHEKASNACAYTSTMRHLAVAHTMHDAVSRCVMLC